ncbi:hypothetical protein GCM10009765_78300 [Fodinicola feengrottensis]|uniref:histidine kinase n=1 Tax=Fodinicola feengrottensis TaxID=435914 RepID=A0ABN2J537_9ACTN
MAFKVPRLRPALLTLGLVYGLVGAAAAAIPPYEVRGVRGAAAVVLLTAIATLGYGGGVLGPARWKTVLLLVATVAASGLNVISPYTGLAFAFTLPWVAAVVVRLWSLVVVSLVGVAVTSVTLFLGGVPESTNFGITMGLLFTGAFAVAIEQVVAARRQTEIAARARAGEAVLAERQRLAREMHDLLAHTLSAQIVHLEGARLLMEHGDRQEQALQQVTRAVRLARDGLDETKRALEALRGDDLRVTDRLEMLAGEFRAVNDGQLALDIALEPESLAAEGRWAIVRTAQEALTNVRKHAAGASVAVRLRCVGTWCELEVTDSGGRPGDLADTGAGFGLTGMRERAELIGGSLLADRSGDGFRVRLRVPLGDPG